MAAAKMETAADKYRKKNKAKRTLEPVTCAVCETEWQCRKYDLSFWISSGIMPTSLAAKFAELGQEGKTTDEQVQMELSPEQLLRSIEFSSTVVRKTAIEPRIVEHPREGQNELGYDEVEACCYRTLRDWQMQGGGQAEALNSFPDK